jgi:methionyl-tRNA formyltransferase
VGQIVGRVGQYRSLSAVFVGEGTLLARCAETFLGAGHRVRAIVAAEPKVREWATRQGIPLLETAQDLIAAQGTVGEPLEPLEPFDYLFSVVNMGILSPEVLALPGRMAINYHDGPLPRYAGAHATSWAILRGERAHGVTWHEMTELVDAGRILVQREVPIAGDDTAVTLNARCYEAALEAFADLVEGLAAGSLVPQPQDLRQRTYFGLHQRPPAAAVIDWSLPAEQTAALARALDFGPAPNPLGIPRLDLGDAVLLAPQVVPLEGASHLLPGTVVGVDGDGLRVTTGSVDVRLPRLLTVDGRPLAGVELATTLGLRPGRRLAAAPEPAASGYQAHDRTRAA